MRFFILSDLHISGPMDDKFRNRIKRLCAKIRTDIQPTEELLFILLGDLINRGDGQAFFHVDGVLSLLQKELQDYAIKFETVPGNHDLVNDSIDSFADFTRQRDLSLISGTRPVYSRKYNGVNFILADSTLTRMHNRPGRLDVEAIRREVDLRSTNNLLFCHHGFTQAHGDTHDVMENGYETLSQLEELGISFVFHAHTHRSDTGAPIRKIVEIGCGSFSADLSGMDGVTHQFVIGNICASGRILVDRWLDVTDGAKGFAHESLYPEQRRFTDPDTVEKIRYEPEEKYMISRRVLPHEAAMQDKLWRLLNEQEEQGLFNIVLKCNILLLADAGQGKTVALRDFAHQLQGTAYFPYLILLKNYTGQSIDELLPPSYQGLPSCRLVLLFDGYDELTNGLQPSFTAQLNEYIQNHPDAHILISSRSNFCKTERNNESSTFPGFQVYDLCELSREDIDRYLCARAIEAERFYSSAKDAYVLDLCKNPFYLTHLADIFLRENRLPRKNELMDKLIEDSFDTDIQKFTGNLEECYTVLFHFLERLAYAMQLLKKGDLEDRKEYQELFSLEERRLAKKSGLLVHEGQSWRFIHNNFREYLAAKYISRLPKDEAIKHFYTESGIKPSWVNTLGYLTGMELNWDLKSWLKDHAPMAYVKFEPDRIDSKTRSDIFIKIFMENEEKHLRIHDLLCTEEEFVRFGSTKFTLDFILDRISNPINSASQKNALRLLSFFPNCYGEEEKITDILVSFCEAYPKTSSAECRLVFLALVKLKLATPDVTEKLMDIFYDSQDDMIRLGLYEYLLSTKENERCVQFYLDGISIDCSDSGDRIGTGRYALMKGLEDISSLAGVTTILDWYCVNMRHYFYGSQDVASAICHTAKELYLQGEETVYQGILQFYIAASSHLEHKLMQNALHFFEDTDTFEKAVMEIANLNDDTNASRFALEGLIGYSKETFSYLAQAYSENRFIEQNKFIELVKTYICDPEEYAYYADLIFKKEAVPLPPLHPPRNYEQERRQGKQEFFDLLFDFDCLQNRVTELLGMSKLESPTVVQIFDEHIEINPNSSLSLLKHTMQRYVYEDTKVSDFCTAVDKDSFLLIEAARAILNEGVAASEEQTQRLLAAMDAAVDSCIRSAPRSNFMKAIVGLAVHFSHPFASDTLLSMTELYASFFENERGEDKKYAYLAAYLSDGCLKMRLVDNIRSKKVDKSVLMDHIEFLAEHSCGEVLGDMTEICKNEKSDTFLRSRALKYVYQFAGGDYVCDEILAYADGEFLIEIKKLCTEIPNRIICARMEEEFGKKADRRLLPYLITMGSRLAVGKYVELVKTENKVPHCDNAEDPTEAIGTLSDPKFLPELEALAAAIFTDGFQDGHFYTLSSSVAKALAHCGVAAPQETKALLIRQRETRLDNESCIHWCNYVIDRIDHMLLNQEDVPLELTDVRKMIRAATSSL